MSFEQTWVESGPNYEIPESVTVSQYPPDADPEHIEREARKQAGIGEDHEKDGRPVESTVELLDNLMGRLRRGEGDVLYRFPPPLNEFELGPGLLTTLGAGPGSGKTALAGQIIFEGLEHNPELHVTIANAEMPFDKLAQRELARRTRVSAKKLRFATLDQDDLEEVEAAAAELRKLLERCDWMRPPYAAKQIGRLADMPPGLLVVDYLQKFAVGEDIRIAVNGVMANLRELCHYGWSVLALSSTTRTHAKGGSGHAAGALTLASFKESGEIEFNVDAAYLLRNHGPRDEAHPYLRDVTLDCVKNRHGDTSPVDLIFNAAGMRFSAPAPVVTEWVPDDGLEGFTDGI